LGGPGATAFALLGSKEAAGDRKTHSGGVLTSKLKLEGFCFDPNRKKVAGREEKSQR
jgi:hypothetical protein